MRGESPACSCLPNYIGIPPNCRPECTINPECPAHLACIQQKCRDPCVGLCGVNAQCSVVNHHAICTCVADYFGNAFSVCEPVLKGKSTYNFYITLALLFNDKIDWVKYYLQKWNAIRKIY